MGFTYFLVTSGLAAVLAQEDDFDYFARGKKNKNKSKGKAPTTTMEPTTTTTTTTTSTTVTDSPVKNYQDPILNEIFNKQPREESYESTTALNDVQSEYNPPQQISYDGDLNLVSVCATPKVQLKL